MMIFMLLPALYLNFYCGNWPKKFSTPVNVLIRTAITFAAGVALMVLYYNISHLVLGTQRGISQPEQFPMIPTIWLINIMLVHHWYMDNWPAWRKVAPVAVPAAARVPVAGDPVGSLAG
jgi:AAT family amino acid transporter